MSQVATRHLFKTLIEELLNMKRTLLVSALLAIALTACGKKEEAAAPAQAPAAAPATEAAKPADTAPAAGAPAAAPHAESKS